MSTAVLDPVRRARKVEPLRPRPTGLCWVFGAEILSGAVGFFALIIQARRLGPAAFARVEYASVVLAWMLVVVRGGVDVIVYREAARRPSLIAQFTDLLVGTRLASACLGYLMVVALAWRIGVERGAAVSIAGLALFASAFTADVGLRASGSLRWIGLAQGVRAVGTLGFIAGCVRSSSDILLASLGLVVAEGLGALLTIIPHARLWGVPRPRFRARAWCVLIHRGAITGATRFGRVTLYGIDMLFLGAYAGSEIGPYAASRRVLFALVAIGIVLPAALGPQIARSWLAGRENARRLVILALEGILALSVPAALGLTLTAERWMPLLFGNSYQRGWPWLALVVARLPWLLTASFAQAVLVACRSEKQSLIHVLGMLTLAIIFLPLGFATNGVWGIGIAVVAVEILGAIVGWSMMSNLGLCSGASAILRPILAGCLGLIVICWLTSPMPVMIQSVAGVIAYGSVWRVTRGGHVN